MDQAVADHRAGARRGRRRAVRGLPLDADAVLRRRQGRPRRAVPGISQDLAWIKLNKVDEDHPEIELKYLPVYQRNQVKETIAVDNRNQAVEKVTELGNQAGACRSKEQRDAAERKAAEDRKKAEEEARKNKGKPGKPATPTPTPTTSQTPPSEEQQKLEKNCSTQQ